MTATKTKPVFDFTGKTVFVAGGTSGINLGVAERFAEAGASVAVLSRKQEKIDAAVKTISGYGVEAKGYSADVRDYDAVKAAFDSAKAEFRAIDIVVSGAAGNFPAFAEGISSNGFRAVLEIDTLGTFHVMRAAYDVITKPGGVLINISAPQAFQAMQMQSHVCAAKAGVDKITETLALEWGPKGLRINSISPGPIDNTEGMDRLAPTPELREMVKGTVPMQRMGAASEIGDAALFLASPAAAYITGAVLPVDGGWGITGAGVATEKMVAAFTGGRT
ncbi:MAG: SDR family oxidoreductase [Pseudomonadota bacterium]